LTEELTVALCGGGTGGHVMPALAVGEEILRQAPGTRLIFIGNRNSLEERLAKAASIDFYPVSIKPLRRGVILPNLGVPFKAGLSVLEAFRILKKNNAKMVFGSGGFSAWPACAAARFGRVPYFLCDGNAYPGLVTRLLGRNAARIYATFEITKTCFKKNAGNVILTGFPVSDSLGRLTKKEARISLGLNAESMTILATGGSGGARTINRTLAEIKKTLLDKGYNLIWQTGKLWDSEKEAIAEMSSNSLVEKFLEPARMAAAIRAADLAVTRCGIMTLSEFAVAGLPAILVPFPHSAEGHQEANAVAVQAAGGGVMIKDHELTPKKLLQTIDELFTPLRLNSMAEGIRKFAKPDAANRIVRDMLETINA